MKKEMFVYVLDCGEVGEHENDFEFRQLERVGNYEAIVYEAEKRKSVYSLEDFQEAINNEELDLSNSFILIRQCGRV